MEIDLLNDYDKKILDVYMSVFYYIRDSLDGAVYNDLNKISLELTKLYFNDYYPDCLCGDKEVNDES